jgi:hypothetical protein
MLSSILEKNQFALILYLGFGCRKDAFVEIKKKPRKYR